jgi:hypothetical protein
VQCLNNSPWYVYNSQSLEDSPRGEKGEVRRNKVVRKRVGGRGSDLAGTLTLRRGGGGIVVGVGGGGGRG